jgi:hypothetical protein
MHKFQANIKIIGTAVKIIGTAIKITRRGSVKNKIMENKIMENKITKNNITKIIFKVNNNNWKRGFIKTMICS